MKLRIIGSNQTEVIKGDGTVIFFSYETPVAAFVPGKGLLRVDTKYSVTTTKHINQWLDGRTAAACPQSFLNEL